MTEPTLAQRLRWIDLCLEASAEAKALFPSPSGMCFGDETPRSNPRFAAAYNFLRVQKMRREGLPLSLLGDGRTAHQRHMERMHGPDPRHETPFEQAERYGRETECAA
jgi:hypothetical protein